MADEPVTDAAAGDQPKQSKETPKFYDHCLSTSHDIDECHAARRLVAYNRLAANAAPISAWKRKERAIEKKQKKGKKTHRGKRGGKSVKAKAEAEKTSPDTTMRQEGENDPRPGGPGWRADLQIRGV
ncbi:hypothetical protein N7528_003678 [Penicillium herquei]|nr:hypothetical protein N7528_003678 [Penicillium herquei]